MLYNYHTNHQAQGIPYGVSIKQNAVLFQNREKRCLQIENL